MSNRKRGGTINKATLAIKLTAKRRRKQDLPTEESPMRRSLNR
jgi:hypothetical protein